MKQDTTIIRISREAHDTLRWISYSERRPIIDIIDEAFRGKGPSLSDKIAQKLNVRNK